MTTCDECKQSTTRRTRLECKKYEMGSSDTLLLCPPCYKEFTREVQE